MNFDGDDVKQAIFDIANEKALGPDGFTNYFFKQSWHYVGLEIVEVVLDFFLDKKVVEAGECYNFVLNSQVWLANGYHTISPHYLL